MKLLEKLEIALSMVFEGSTTCSEKIIKEWIKDAKKLEVRPEDMMLCEKCEEEMAELDGLCRDCIELGHGEDNNDDMPYGSEYATDPDSDHDDPNDD